MWARVSIEKSIKRSSTVISNYGIKIICFLLSMSQKINRIKAYLLYSMKILRNISKMNDAKPFKYFHARCTLKWCCQKIQMLSLFLSSALSVLYVQARKISMPTIVKMSSLKKIMVQAMCSYFEIIFDILLKSRVFSHLFTRSLSLDFDLSITYLNHTTFSRVSIMCFTFF